VSWAAAAWTVGRWLRYWLSTRTSIRPTTLRSYTEHVERHLIPHLGRVRLALLTGRDVAGMFASLAATGTAGHQPGGVAPDPRHTAGGAECGGAGRAADRQPSPPGGATDAAATAGARVDRPAGRGLAAAGRARYSVAVWTARQLAAFLDSVTGDGLYDQSPSASGPPSTIRSRASPPRGLPAHLDQPGQGQLAGRRLPAQPSDPRLGRSYSRACGRGCRSSSKKRARPVSGQQDPHLRPTPTPADPPSTAALPGTRQPRRPAPDADPLLGERGTCSSGVSQF
jgi:hypothetical protein